MSLTGKNDGTYHPIHFRAPVSIHPPSLRSQLASTSCSNPTKESGPLVSQRATSQRPRSNVPCCGHQRHRNKETEDDARPSRGGTRQAEAPAKTNKSTSTTSRESTTTTGKRDERGAPLSAITCVPRCRCIFFGPASRSAPFPWPIQPRSPPPSPARWRPGGPSRPLSTPGPEPAPSSIRARSTGCVLGRGRTIRRTSTDPTHGTSPWISPLGSVSSPADLSGLGCCPPMLRLQATGLDSPR